MSFDDFEDEQPRSVLPADLDALLSRRFPNDGKEHYASDQALEVLARVLPHIEDTADVIGTVFPYDGPHSRDTVIDAARAMAAIGRYLNNATQPGKATLEWGSTIGSIIGSVKTVLFQFDQLLDQLAEGSLRLAEDPTLYSDQTPYPKGMPHEQWMAARHDDGVRTAMTLADQLRQIRTALVTWDSQGFFPIGGIPTQLEKPHSLAIQLGHDTPLEDD
ncbi:hypothetical protein [Amycolatopsis sp. NPDC051903]|uniref:hypothetical protein n=1 Tax=Amycolatopsis sp. NPDC051903 TaxID=3363936 RepID=UPI0037902154